VLVIRSQMGEFVVGWVKLRVELTNYKLTNPLISSPFSCVCLHLLHLIALFCFPCLLHPTHITPPNPQHLLSHWLTTTINYPIPSLYNTANSVNNLLFLYCPTMKAASSSKMPVDNYQSTCHHIPEDCNVHNKTN
jgi:hypothetical protein